MYQNLNCKGYALIEYETFNEAKNALNAMNGKQINSHQINVNWAFVKEPLKEKRSRLDSLIPSQNKIHFNNT